VQPSDSIIIGNATDNLNTTMDQDHVLTEPKNGLCPSHRMDVLHPGSNVLTLPSA
jgi:hypothetical protein